MLLRCRSQRNTVATKDRLITRPAQLEQRKRHSMRHCAKPTALVEGYSTDPTIQVGFNVADSVVAEAQDQIGQVMRAPGERKQFAQMNTGRIRHTRYAEGIEFAMNAGELISSIAGTELGIVTPITGDLYDINFVWYADSLQGLKDLQDKLNASEEYQELFANGSELFESKYESNIVMMVS